MSSASWNLSSISRALCTARHEAGFSLSWTAQRAFPGRVCSLHMSAYGRIIRLFRVVVWTAWCRMRKGGGYVVQHSGRGKGSQHSCFRD
jgi:hypothetical protein